MALSQENDNPTTNCKGKYLIPAIVRREINFKGCSFTPNQMLALSSVLRQCEQIDLKLTTCSLNPENLDILHTGLGSSVKIRKLDVGWNDEIGEDGCELIGLIAKESKVEELGMQECEITAEGLRRFHQALNGAKIRKLNIASNYDIGEDACEYIGKITKESKVEELCIEKCDITAQGFKRFLESLTGAKIRRLDVGSNYDIGDDGCGYIGAITNECKVEELGMPACSITALGLRRFHVALNGAKIRKLDIGSNDDIGEDGCGSIGAIMKESKVEELCIEYCDITAEGLRRLHDALNGTKIRKLNLEGNNTIGEEGYGYIGAITKESEVEELVMASCNISAQGLRRFFNALNGAKIRKLDISNNGIGEDGCGCVGEIMKGSKVEELCVEKCDITAQGLKRFHDALNGAKIRKLDIGWNTDLGNDGCRSIGAITKDSRIEDLRIAVCKITAEGLRRFHKALKGAKIRKLNVGGNRDIGEDGCDYIGAITKESKVEELGMTACDITAQGMKSFHEALKGAKIRKLNVGGNRDIGEDGCGYIGAITKESKVEELGMAACDITAQGMKSFHEALNGAKIKKFNLSSNCTQGRVGPPTCSMGDDGIQILEQLIERGQIEELEIKKCFLTKQQKLVLCNAAELSGTMLTPHPAF